MSEKLSKGQKILLVMLYTLIILMIIYSIGSIKNSGEEGYNRCIQWKCQKGGQEYCTKAREVNNCCSGAGGLLASSGNKAVCMFDKK